METQFPFWKDGYKSNADERLSAWVPFPHLQRQFLLPVIQRTNQLVPTFNEDGSVSCDTQNPKHPELAKLVDNFIISVSQVYAKEKQYLATITAYSDFIKLVKALILANYKITDEQLLPVLTMNAKDFEKLFNIVFLHCLGG